MVEELAARGIVVSHGTVSLTCVLAADVVGYSRLMGLDETGTVAALREHRAAADPLIAQQGGRIVRLPVTASSSSLARWSAPSSAPWGCNNWRQSEMPGPLSTDAWNGVSASISAMS